ncbi:hypothetical protein NEOCIP111885_00268 [Pseudoneobacillus rhizosphaerae]|uniref:Uncharacterized protein n=1 Tax=Pseudoneobacillus rhizosphaerae TaxID=2880968 RepID=A0A9C7G6I0_9BACI|nr:hypothetical protein NEOCIP111885_00268 [Pseudoneobacillus rhizosphaerae]
MPDTIKRQNGQFFRVESTLYFNKEEVSKTYVFETSSLYFIIRNLRLVGDHEPMADKTK